MLMRCKIHRDGGTQVELPNGDGQPVTVYHFKPNANGEHIVDVPVRAHAETLLGIPEAYEPFGAEAQAEADALVRDTNVLTTVERVVKPSLTKYDKKTHQELRDEWKLLFGRHPPPLMKIETLRQRLAARLLTSLSETDAEE